MKVLDTIYESYKKLFITNESMKSLNNIIVPPFAINTPWKKKKVDGMITLVFMIVKENLI